MFMIPRQGVIVENMLIQCLVLTHSHNFLHRNFGQVAVEFEIMQQARMTLAKSPPGTTVGGW